MPARGQMKPVRWIAEDRGYETPCWTWQLYVMPTTGYGQMAYRRDGHRKVLYAHRYYYEQAKGPIPKGMCIDHLCRNRNCVNPEHLEVVTPRENSRRSILTKLTLRDVEEIRDAALSGREMRKDIARRYGVTPTHVAFIANGKTWRDGARAKVH